MMTTLAARPAAMSDAPKRPAAKPAMLKIRVKKTSGTRELTTLARANPVVQTLV